MDTKKFLLPCILTLTSCCPISLSYTPSQSLKDYSDTDYNKFDLTYSVSYFSNRNDLIGFSDQVKLSKKIGEHLRLTHQFEMVTQTDFKEKSNYHVHFDIKRMGPSTGDDVAVGLTSGYSLFLIPTFQTFTTDLSAVMFYKQQKIHSISTAEVQKWIIWLPMAPFGIVWNNWVANHFVENRLIRYIVNDVSETHHDWMINDKFTSFEKKEKKTSKTIQTVSPEKTKLTSQIQTYLIGFGFYNGSTDGIITPDLRAAIVQYQIQNKLTADGTITSKLLSHMKKTSQSVGISITRKGKARDNFKADASLPQWMNIYFQEGLIVQSDSKYKNYIGEGLTIEETFKDVKTQIANEYLSNNGDLAKSIVCERTAVQTYKDRTFGLYRCLKSDIEKARMQIKK